MEFEASLRVIFLAGKVKLLWSLIYSTTILYDTVTLISSTISKCNQAQKCFLARSKILHVMLLDHVIYF